MPSIYEAGDERKRRQRQHVLHKIVCRVCEGTFQVFGGQVNLFKYCGVECRLAARRLAHDPVAHHQQYLANREKRLAQSKVWRAANQEKRNTARRKRRAEQKSDPNARRRASLLNHESYIRNREKRLAYSKTYNAAHKEHRAAAARKRYAGKNLAQANISGTSVTSGTNALFLTRSAPIELLAKGQQL